jgi:glycosyltransferase involved in cell wall biosynthesis
MRVLTWHVHGSYLHYLSHAPHDFYVPVREGRPPRYSGLPAGGFPWRPNLHEIAAHEVAHEKFDVVLFQHRDNWTVDQHELLSDAHRRGPRVYLEHDPPRSSPFDEPHPIDDPNVLVVHVTPFNDLMYVTRAPTRVIEHGVVVPDGVRWTGQLDRGIVVVNNIARRGRRLGVDVLARVKEAGVPLDLVGMGAEEAGGLGEVRPDELAAFQTRYRFFFNPIRWTSLGLAVCEAMMLGMPMVVLATGEHAVAVQDGTSGIVDTSVPRLIDGMNALLQDRGEAERLGKGARERALERYGIDRFARDWDETLRQMTS